MSAKEANISQVSALSSKSLFILRMTKDLISLEAQLPRVLKKFVQKESSSTRRQLYKPDHDLLAHSNFLLKFIAQGARTLFCW